MFLSKLYFTNISYKIERLFKLYFMHLNIENVNLESLHQTTKTNPEKYKLYNLLFSGKINLKEYLKALQYLKHRNT